MIKYFDLESYKELERLKKNNQISPEDQKKLRGYRINVSNQVKYNNKIAYVSLLQEYLGQKIPILKFQSKFLELQKQNLKKTQIILEDSKKLGNLVLDEES